MVAYEQATVSIFNTFSDAQHSMDDAICSHPDLLGDSFHVESSGRPYMVLPMLALIFLLLDPLLRVSLYPLVVMLGHLLLVLGHLLRSLVSDFVQTIQVQLQLVVVTTFVKELLPEALMIFSNVQFVTSVCPLAWGCPRDEYLFLMLRLKQNNLNP